MFSLSNVILELYGYFASVLQNEDIAVSIQIRTKFVFWPKKSIFKSFKFSPYIVQTDYIDDKPVLLTDFSRGLILVSEAP